MLGRYTTGPSNERAQVYHEGIAVSIKKTEYVYNPLVDLPCFTAFGFQGGGIFFVVYYLHAHCALISLLF